MSGSPRHLGRPRLQEQAIPTKVRILQTATKLFIEQGYKNASMDEVALRTNVTKATVYYYYKTKAELFTAAIVGLMKIIRENSVAILSTDETFENRLHKLVTVFSHATVNVDINNFIKEATPSLNEEQLLIIQHSEEEMHDAVEACFAREMEKGVLPLNNTKFITHIFLSVLNMTKYRDSNGQGFFPTPEQTTTEIIRFFWKGIQPSTND
ncbi:MAG: TetR/AcrR family transcriptional regulator [Kurthia sp.]|nr:TetR/AcrR family transcriptional regulator [Candidatus Kurthia equi]